MRQRGSALLYVILAVFVASAGAGIVYTYTNAITRAEKAETDRDKWQKAADERATAIASLLKEKAKVDKELSRRQGARNAADEISRKVDAKLAAAFQTPEAQEWAKTAVPQSVVDSLRNTGPGSSSDAKAGDISPTRKPSAKVEGGGVAGSDVKRATP